MSTQMIDPKIIAFDPPDEPVPEKFTEIFKLQVKNRIAKPITIMRTKNGYKLLDGRRRVIAAIRAGLAEIPAVVKEGPEMIPNPVMVGRMPRGKHV